MAATAMAGLFAQPLARLGPPWLWTGADRPCTVTRSLAHSFTQQRQFRGSRAKEWSLERQEAQIRGSRGAAMPLAWRQMDFPRASGRRLLGAARRRGTRPGTCASLSDHPRCNMFFAYAGYMFVFAFCCLNFFSEHLNIVRLLFSFIISQDCNSSIL